MKAKQVKCINCDTENHRLRDICVKCGASLPVIKRDSFFRKRTFAIVVSLLLVWIAGFAYFSRENPVPTVKITETISTVDKEVYVEEKQKELKKAKQQAARRVQSTVQSAKKEAVTKTSEIFSEDLKDEKNIVAGQVIITDPWGMQVTQFRAGVAGSGWLALPARACFGGNRWHFYADSGQKTEIFNGLWIPGDKVGLWHLAGNAGNFVGPQLASWDERETVSWSSLESADEYQAIKLLSDGTEGYFISSSLPDHINEIGIFVQNSKVVGWSFGQLLDKGYMWTGKAENDLKYNTQVRYFYDITFANGREEKFAMALAMQKGYARLEQLSSFIKGFRMQPKLALEDTPSYLLPEEIVKQMRVIVAGAIENGEGSRAADLLSGQILKDIGDIGLLMDIVPAIAAASGYEAAIGEIEGSGQYIVRQKGLDVPELNKLHMQLYQYWIQSLVSTGEVNEGLRAYNLANAYYPDDPYIHLLAVELVLLSGDWEEAERLLYMRNYPPAFKDRYQLIASRIAEMKKQEGKIVIRFPGESSRINVTAAVNETLNQSFLVDTGATIVTIPSSAAEALDLKTVHENITLSTVSGVVTTREVIIDSIEIDGWVEYDIRALVVDMPKYPGLGLLGLNYLGRFEMDLKTADGILLLMPR